MRLVIDGADETMRSHAVLLKAQRPSRKGVRSKWGGNGDQPVSVDDMVCSAWRHAAGLTIRGSHNAASRTLKVDFPSLDIVVNASGGGSDIVSKQMPGRASRRADGKDKAYVVDFIHEWDYETQGRKRKPGPLLSSDMSRRRSYSELGFVQHTVDSIDELPFMEKTT